jgi:transcriptional regulator NrdR family protein
MRVTDTRRLVGNPQAVRRRRTCDECGTSFQTDERPRLWVVRDGDRELFLRGVLLASLRRAIDEADPSVPEKSLLEVVRSVIVGFLAEGTDSVSPAATRKRTSEALLEQGLDEVASRYEPLLDPDLFAIRKRDGSEQPFDPEKLRRSISAASIKLIKPEQIRLAVDEVLGEVGATSGTLDTTELREIVGAVLRRHDERAFLRFALVDAHRDESLDHFLDRIAPAAQVRKRDDSVVLFDGGKLARSILRSFVPERRGELAASVAELVTAEERRVRTLMTTEQMPETTANIGARVLEWLFEVDERAWANYWLVFASDHELLPGGSPAQQLAKAQEEMRARTESKVSDR